MGIRFRCHHCEFELHVKDFQAGKRGKCPECKGRFRVPLETTEHSLDADSELEAVGVAAAESSSRAAQEFPPGSPTVSPAAADVAPTGESTDSPHPQSPTSPEAKPNSEASQPPANVSASSDPVSSGPVEAVDEAAMPVAPPSVASIPERFREAPEAKWYVRPPAGGQYGPATLEDFEQWLSEKRVTHDSLIWREGWPEWLNAAKALPELFAPEPASPPIPTVPTTGTQPTGPAAAISNDSASASPSGMLVGGIQAGGSLTGGASSASTTIEKNRIEKKRRKKRNYTVMIAVLTVIAILLIAALIIVLMIQGN